MHAGILPVWGAQTGWSGGGRAGGGGLGGLEGLEGLGGLGGWGTGYRRRCPAPPASLPP